MLEPSQEKTTLPIIDEKNCNIVDLQRIKRKRQKHDIAAEEALFIQKMQTELLAGTLQQKPGDIVMSGIIHMMCVMCLVFFPRTTRFFYANSGRRNFISSRAGSECLQNSVTCPCKKCHCAVEAKRRATNDGFVYTLLNKYPELTEKWFYGTLEKQGRRGTITNVVMKLTSNQSNCVGIHREDNTKGHVPENCFLEVQELNAPQYGGVIPNLKDPWILIFMHFSCVYERRGEDMVDHLQKFRNEFEKTPKDLGIIRRSYDNKNEYTAKCREIHFKAILMGQIRNHIQDDIRLGRFQLPKNMSVGQLAKKVYPNAILQLEKQHGCCLYTQIGMTHLKSWNQLSLERDNNNLPHFTAGGEMENCAFICRILNVARKLSTTMLLEYFLEQKLVPVSSDARQRVEEVLGRKSK